MAIWSKLFYNVDASPRTNSMIWWTWESIFHHLYFIVLWFQRQSSEKWKHGDDQLWRLNMEKECEFFKQLFGGDSLLCTEGTITLFAGLWFRTDKPVQAQLMWIGRLISNYQQCEAILHFLIFLLGLVIVLFLSKADGAKYGSAAPAVIRWTFFLALLFEVITMCVPYSAMFTWVFMPFMNDDGQISVLADQIKAKASGDDFLSGVQLGAALITMAWVSHVVLILDTCALVKAWYFAMNGQSTILIDLAFWGLVLAFIWSMVIDFFSPSGRGFYGEPTMSTVALDALQALFGDNPTPMSEVVNSSTTSLLYP